MTIMNVNTALLKERLDCLYTDFNMLADGSWVPDGQSIDASTEMVERIAKMFLIELQDTRGEVVDDNT